MSGEMENTKENEGSTSPEETLQANPAVAAASFLEQHKQEEPSVAELCEMLRVLPDIKPTILETKLYLPESLHRAIRDNKNFELGKTSSAMLRITIPAFLSFVEIEGSPSLEEYLSDDGKWISIAPTKIDSLSGVLRLHIGAFCSAVRLSKRPSWRSSPRIHIRRFEPYGFGSFGNLEWQTAYINFVRQVDYCRSQIAAQVADVQAQTDALETAKNSENARLESEKNLLQQERAEWESRLASLRVENTSVETTLVALKTEKLSIESALQSAINARTQEEARLSEAEENTRQESEKLSEISAAIQQKGNLGESLDRQMADKRNKLDELNRDISLFAVDLKGYGGQRNRQVRLYALFLGLCLALGLWLTSFAFDRVDEIWREIVKDPQRITWSLVAITRVSVFIVYASVIGALSTLAYTFVRRIVQLHDRELRLSEMSIIARDVTEASLTETAATPEQRVAAFFSARMILIRNLIAGTFDRIQSADSSEKESHLNELRLTDASQILKVIRDIGLGVQDKGPQK